MIPLDRRRIGPPGRVTVWGRPWHGLVEGGTLTLPNGATMPHPYPGDAGDADVLAFRLPGTPAVVRSPEQAAADAAAGRQWLDYALISGRYDRQLYGQSIGGNGTWLYAAPDGSRWLATLAGVPDTHDLTAPWTTTVTCARFGDFGAAPEEHVLTASLADWQQSIPGHPDGDYALDYMGIVDSANVWVEDVTPTGDAAILMIGMDAGAQLIDRRPTGFLQLDLSGTPGIDATAALTVLRTRAQTLGTVSWSEVYDLVTRRYQRENTTTVTIVGGYPTCDGYQSIVTTEVPGTMVAGSVSPFDVFWTIGSFDASSSISNRIIGMAFVDGTPRALLMSASNTTIDAYPSPDISAGGSAERRTPFTGPFPPGAGEGCFMGGAELISSTIFWSLSQTITRHTTSTMTLAYEGGEAVTLAASYHQQRFGTLTHDSIGNMRNGFEEWTIGDTTYTFTYPTEAIGTPGGLFGPLQLLGFFRQERPDDAFMADMHQVPIGNNNVGFFNHEINRYSATCAEIATDHITPTGIHEWTRWGAVAPTSVATGKVVGNNPHGSAHPITGEIVRASAVPVIWV